MSRFSYSSAGRAKNFLIDYIVKEDGATAFKNGLLREKRRELLRKLNRREPRKRS